MKFYKLILAVSVPFILSVCESIPNNVQTLGTTLNNGIKISMKYLALLGQQATHLQGKQKQQASQEC